MSFKEFASAVVKTAPLWSVGVNAFIAWITAGDSIKGKCPIKAMVFIVIYAVVLLSLAIYSIVP